MQPVYEYGDEVRVIRNVRNDGTYPGRHNGELLVRRGSTGFIRNRGTFLQDQVIYEVHFLEQGMVIGCREEELINLDEEWVESRFEFREKVRAAKQLCAGDKVFAELGDEGQVLKVLRHQEGGVAYHVRFPGHTILVPESALEPAGSPSPRQLERSSKDGRHRPQS